MKHVPVLLLPITAAALAAVYTLVSPGPPPVHSFYETTAVVMPVLIVALAVERRALAIFERQATIHRYVMFAFLIGGESCALLGASGVFRAGRTFSDTANFTGGMVASRSWLTDLLAAGTIAGLVGGFVMLAVLAVFGPSWLGKHPPPMP